MENKGFGMVEGVECGWEDVDNELVGEELWVVDVGFGCVGEVSGVVDLWGEEVWGGNVVDRVVV